MDEDFHERFLKGNANSEFMAYRLSDLVRSLVRATAANSDPASQVYQASETLKFLIELMSHADGIQPYEIVHKAAEDLHVEEGRDPVDEAILHAAKMGARYLIEMSCSDNAARGRASKRRDEFLTAVKWIEEAREERRIQSKFRL